MVMAVADGRRTTAAVAEKFDPKMLLLRTIAFQYAIEVRQGFPQVLHQFFWKPCSWARIYRVVSPSLGGNGTVVPAVVRLTLSQYVQSN